MDHNKLTSALQVGPEPLQYTPHQPGRGRPAYSIPDTRQNPTG